MVVPAGRVVTEVAQSLIESVFLDVKNGVAGGAVADAIDARGPDLQAGGGPSVPAAEQLPQMLSSLCRCQWVGNRSAIGVAREFRGGDAPDPRGAVADDGQLVGVTGAEADAFYSQGSRTRLGSKAAM